MYNSLILNKNSFQKIWPVKKLFVSLLSKVLINTNIGRVYKKS
jgi:hypothetical protein